MNRAIEEVRNAIILEIYNDLKELKEAEGETVESFDLWCCANVNQLAQMIAEKLEQSPVIVNGYSIRYNSVVNTYNLSHPEIGANFERYTYLSDAIENSLKG